MEPASPASIAPPGPSSAGLRVGLITGGAMLALVIVAAVAVPDSGRISPGKTVNAQMPLL